MEAVAEAMHGTEKAIYSGCSKFAADAPQIALDNVADGRRHFAPNRSNDHRAGVRPARVAHEKLEDPESSGREVEYLIRN